MYTVRLLVAVRGSGRSWAVIGPTGLLVTSAAGFLEMFTREDDALARAAWYNQQAGN